jgi:diacylglycerol kinase family enzyme
MKLRHGAVDLSGRLSWRPTWQEFAAVVEEAGTPPHVFVTSQQGAAIAFTSQASVAGPGHILTPLCIVWTNDSEEMRDGGQHR